MTDWLPCASKQGATERTTGPVPAGGSASGCAREPHTVTAGSGAGCWAYVTDGAASATTIARPADTPPALNISPILDCRGCHSVGDCVGVVVAQAFRP